MVSLDVPLFCIFISAGIIRNYSCIFLLELLFLPLKELVQGRGIYLMVVGGGLVVVVLSLCLAGLFVSSVCCVFGRGFL